MIPPDRNSGSSAPRSGFRHQPAPEALVLLAVGEASADAGAEIRLGSAQGRRSFPGARLEARAWAERSLLPARRGRTGAAGGPGRSPGCAGPPREAAAAPVGRRAGCTAPQRAATPKTRGGDAGQHVAEPGKDRHEIVGPRPIVESPSQSSAGWSKAGPASRVGARREARPRDERQGRAQRRGRGRSRPRWGAGCRRR